MRVAGNTRSSLVVRRVAIYEGAAALAAAPS
jgi:hypothetical protein